tara:strand:- start:144 stop:1154 length:1011 start_codon:yes stop_codon:yes gene_type:complete
MRFRAHHLFFFSPSRLFLFLSVKALSNSRLRKRTYLEPPLSTDDGCIIAVLSLSLSLSLSARACACAQQAIEKYTESIRLDDTNPAVYTNRAAAHFNLKHFSQALLDSETSTTLDEKWTKGYYRKARCLHAMSDNSSNSSTTTKKNKYENVQEAIEALRIGVRYDPTNAQANAFLRELELESLSLPKDYFEMKARAKEMFRGGKFEDAIQMYGEALRDEEKRRERGEVLESSGATTASNNNNSISNSLRATLFLNRAECYRQMGQMQECEKDCEEALQLDPQNEKGLLRRALCREHFERFDEALEDFESAKRSSPSSLLASSGIERCKKLAAAARE